MPRETEWLSVKEAAVVMAISAKLVRSLIRARRLRVSRVGRILRISKSAIEEFMEEAEE